MLHVFPLQKTVWNFGPAFPQGRSLRFSFLYKFPATHGNKRKQNSRSPTNVRNLFFSVVNKWWTCHWFDSFSRASKNQSWITFWTRGCWRALHSNLKYCVNYSLWRKTRKFATVRNDSVNSCGILLYHYRQVRFPLYCILGFNTTCYIGEHCGFSRTRKVGRRLFRPDLVHVYLSL